MWWLYVVLAAPAVAVLAGILIAAPRAARRGQSHLSEGVDRSTGLWWAPWIPLGWSRRRTPADDRIAAELHEMAETQRREGERKARR